MFLGLNILLYCGHAQCNYTISFNSWISTYCITLSLKFYFCSWCTYNISLCILCWHVDSVLTIEPNWSTFFTGESVTLICDIREGKETDWYYRFLRDGQELLYSYTEKRSYTIQTLHTGYSGQYQCSGLHKRNQNWAERSNKVSLTVSCK